TRAENRVRDCRTLGASVGAGKPVVLARHRGTYVQSLDDAVVHRHVAVFEEAAECDLVVGEVAARDPESRRWRFVFFASGAPRDQFVPDRLASCPSFREYVIGAES